MKKIALISTYCDNNEKLNALRNTIIEYKNLGVDIFVYSPLKLPQDIELECKFLFYTDENPVLTYPIRGQLYWLEYKLKNSNTVKFILTTSDYGWASNYQLKKLINIGSTYDYDIYYLTIYDLEFDNNVKSIIKDNVINIVNSSSRGFAHSLHFTPFDKDTMIKAEKFFNYSDYVNNLDRPAEYVAFRWVEELGMELKQESVNDTIINNTDLFNISNNDNYKFFINNDEDNIKFVFTEIKDEIQIQINDYTIDGEIESNYLYKTQLKLNNLERFVIYNDNYTDEYVDIIKQGYEKFKIEEL